MLFHFIQLWYPYLYKVRCIHRSSSKIAPLITNPWLKVYVYWRSDPLNNPILHHIMERAKLFKVGHSWNIIVLVFFGLNVMSQCLLCSNHGKLSSPPKLREKIKTKHFLSNTIVCVSNHTVIVFVFFVFFPWGKGEIVKSPIINI